MKKLDKKNANEVSVDIHSTKKETLKEDIKHKVQNQKDFLQKMKEIVQKKIYLKKKRVKKDKKL